MTVYPLGPVREGGGTTFVFIGDPNMPVRWVLTGPGTITPSTDRTNGAGVASAKYDAGAGVAGQSITVRVDVYA